MKHKIIRKTIVLTSLSVALLQASCTVDRQVYVRHSDKITYAETIVYSEDLLNTNEVCSESKKNSAQETKDATEKKVNNNAKIMKY